MPIAWRGQLLTAQPWPRVAGADCLPRLLSVRRGLRLTGSGSSAAPSRPIERLADRLENDHPGLVVSGMWSPSREELDTRFRRRSPRRSGRHDTDILVVCLGKPRQEHWVARYGRRNAGKAFPALRGCRGLPRGNEAPCAAVDAAVRAGVVLPAQSRATTVGPALPDPGPRRTPSGSSRTARLRTWRLLLRR